MDPEELFEKLIKNQISREEFERLLEGVDDESILARYEVYLQAQFEKEIDKHLAEKDEVFVRKEGHLKVTKPLTQTGTKYSHKPRNSGFRVTAIAASLAVLLIAGLFVVFQTDLLSGNGKIAEAEGDANLITKSTPTGRMFRMNLDDGSFIHMNAVSSITYPRQFGENKREVEISGEAYFDVERDETRPFNIKVKDYQVQVLGTSFNIQAYEDEEDFSVTVESGKVKVVFDDSGKNSATLKKNQKLIYNPKTRVFKILDVESAQELNWRKGILHFDSTPMNKVEKILERWYGIDLVINSNKIYDKTLTGLHHNENLESVLEAVAYATGTKYVVRGDSVVVLKLK